MTVTQLLIDNINACNDPSGLAFRRTQCNFAKLLVQLCEDFRGLERECKELMKPHVREVLRGKRVKLFGHFLNEFSYPDAKIAEEMAVGFPLCGRLPASGVFRAKVRAPEINEGFLRKVARSLSARSIAATVSACDVEADHKLWQATLDEVAEGFFSGPLDLSELGSESAVSPRFGLQQKNKLRPIDNFSASHVNRATGLQERFVVDTADEICAMIKTWMQQGGSGIRLVGKTHDMRKAYRQIAICEPHLDFAWIVVWNLELQQPALFRMRTMPFGATASVGTFLRLSQAIKDGQTAFPDFGLPEGWFTVGSTEARKTELRDKIHTILSNDELEPNTAESLRSRLLFADAQWYGRFSKIALHRIGAVGLKTRVEKPLSVSVRSSLEWMLQRVLTDAPRRVDTGGRPTFFLFLDGACTEKNDLHWSGASIGAVLADSYGRFLHFFGHVVHDDLIFSCGPPNKVQHIFEAEVLPYAISLFVWPDILQNCCVFAFIDKEAAIKPRGFQVLLVQQLQVQLYIHNGTVMEADRDAHPFLLAFPLLRTWVTTHPEVALRCSRKWVQFAPKSLTT
eukprot:s572_g6.t1